jgi:hypothetical protein
LRSVLRLLRFCLLPSVGSFLLVDLAAAYYSEGKPDCTQLTNFRHTPPTQSSSSLLLKLHEKERKTLIHSSQNSVCASANTSHFSPSATPLSKNFVCFYIINSHQLPLLFSTCGLASTLANFCQLDLLHTLTQPAVRLSTRPVCKERNEEDEGETQPPPSPPSCPGFSPMHVHTCMCMHGNCLVDPPSPVSIRLLEFLFIQLFVTLSIRHSGTLSIRLSVQQLVN